MEENKKVKGYPLFEGLDSDRSMKDDEYSTTGDGHASRHAGGKVSTTGDGHKEYSTTGDGHAPRYGKGEHSTTGDGHPARHKESFVDKMMDKLTGEDHARS